MFVNNKKLPQAMFLGKTFYHYNRLMVTHIGMKLSTHTYYVTPMTHKWFPWQPPTIASGANHSGEICMQVYLSVSMMSSSLRHSIIL